MGMVRDASGPAFILKETPASSHATPHLARPMDRRRLFNALFSAAVVVALLLGIGLALGGLSRAAEWAWIAAAGLAFAVTLADSIAAVLQRRIGVDLLALLAIGGALVLGENLAGAVIALMLASGRALEDYAQRRAQREMSALLARMPRTASRYENAGIVAVPLDDIVAGDRLLVRPGETVPTDGRLLSALAVTDDSPLTGEPLPVTRNAGSLLQSGSVNAGAPFDMLATRPARDSAFAAIVRLVQSARDSQAPAARLADRYALLFIPLTLFIAGAAWLASGDPVRALAVVVVATPCPLILAVPVAIVGAMSRCARAGVLVKHGAAIERLALARTLFFDKTGTLTAGQARLEDIATAPEFDAQQVLAWAAGLEQMSGHAIAGAVVEAAHARGLTLPVPSAVSEEPGAGVSGEVERRRLRVGSYAYVAGNAPPPRWADAFGRRSARESAAMVYVAVDGTLAGALHMTDRMRTDAPRALRLLRAAGMRRIVMLTGDRQATAEAIGQALAVDEVRAGQTPQTKLDAVAAARKEGIVLMVGDGINDAPALAAAQVGIAMGARGSPAAAEAAHVILLADRLDRLAFAVRIAQGTRRIALQSVMAGMGLSLAAMIVAAFGYLPPLAGALLQEGIDVATILNALRVLRLERRRAGEGISAEQAQHLHDEHIQLQPVLDRINTLARQTHALSPEQLERELENLLSALRNILLPHERHDEADVYPLVARLIGGTDPLAPMSHTHREIQRLIRALERMAEDLRNDALDQVELQRTLYVLDAILRMHFAQEEEIFQNLT